MRARARAIVIRDNDVLSTPGCSIFFLSSLNSLFFSSAKRNCQSRLSGPLQRVGMVVIGANALLNAVFALYRTIANANRIYLARIPILYRSLYYFLYRAASSSIFGKIDKANVVDRMEESRREIFYFPPINELFALNDGTLSTDARFSVQIIRIRRTKGTNGFIFSFHREN